MKPFPNQLSEEQIKLFNSGDAFAFQAVFDHFRMRIFYFVQKLINDAFAAEEITSDTFVKLYNLKGRFSAEIRIQAFLYITARNASLDFIKSRQRERKHVVDLPNFEEVDFDNPYYATTHIEADVLNYIYREIEKLPERARIIFKMFYLEGHSVDDIANAMKISTQTVANQKTTALKALRIRMLDRPKVFLFLLALIDQK